MGFYLKDWVSLHFSNLLHLQQYPETAYANNRFEITLIIINLVPSIDDQNHGSIQPHSPDASITFASDHCYCTSAQNSDDLTTHRICPEPEKFNTVTVNTNSSSNENFSSDHTYCISDIQQSSRVLTISTTHKRPKIICNENNNSKKRKFNAISNTNLKHSYAHMLDKTVPNAPETYDDPTVTNQSCSANSNHTYSVCNSLSIQLLTAPDSSFDHSVGDANLKSNFMAVKKIPVALKVNCAIWSHIQYSTYPSGEEDYSSKKQKYTTTVELFF